MDNRNRTLYLPVYLAVVFHVCGYFGMQSSFREWFIAATPLTLLLMAAMIVLTLEKRSRQFWLFVALCFFTGIAVEYIGVNTGILFGQYTYGNAMGPKIGGVPLMIGIQWYVTIWSMGHLTLWVMRKTGVPPEKSAGNAMAGIFIGALLTTVFDVILEPAAIALGYWQWYPDNVVPVYNYTCWFIVSAILLSPFFFRKEFYSETHYFPILLAFIQAVFFIVVR